MSHNALTDASGLEGCLNLRILNVDHNSFTSLASFPILLSLDTFSISYNKLNNLEQTVKHLSSKVCTRGLNPTVVPKNGAHLLDEEPNQPNV